MSYPEKQIIKKQFKNPEAFSLEKEERILDYLMEGLGRPFKEIGRMVLKKQATVETVTGPDTNTKSAIVRKGSEMIYSTSNEQEISALELLAKGEQYATDYFMSDKNE